MTACKQGESHCIIARNDEDGPIGCGWGQGLIAVPCRSRCPDFLIRNRDSNTAGARGTPYIMKLIGTDVHGAIRIPF